METNLWLVSKKLKLKINLVQASYCTCVDFLFEKVANKSEGVGRESTQNLGESLRGELP